MEKTKLGLNSIINFICILFFTTMVICYLGVFFKFNGQVASLHDLVGFPMDNTSLQEYIINNTSNSAYVSGRALNYNAFVYAPILIIIMSVAGIILFAFKIKSENLWIYDICYGIVGILSFSIVDILRLGKTWKLQVVIISLVLLSGLIQVVLKYVFKKDISFSANNQKIKTSLIALLGVVSIVSIVLFTPSNLKIKKQNSKPK